MSALTLRPKRHPTLWHLRRCGSAPPRQPDAPRGLPRSRFARLRLLRGAGKAAARFRGAGSDCRTARTRPAARGRLSSGFRDWRRKSPSWETTWVPLRCEGSGRRRGGGAGPARLCLRAAFAPAASARAAGKAAAAGSIKPKCFLFQTIKRHQDTRGAARREETARSALPLPSARRLPARTGPAPTWHRDDGEGVGGCKRRCPPGAPAGATDRAGHGQGASTRGGQPGPRLSPDEAAPSSCGRAGRRGPCCCCLVPQHHARGASVCIPAQPSRPRYSNSEHSASGKPAGASAGRQRCGIEGHSGAPRQGTPAGAGRGSTRPGSRRCPSLGQRVSHNEPL